MDRVIKDFQTTSLPCTFGVTVPSGFEFCAKEEIENKLDVDGKNIEIGQGKVYFQAPICCLAKLHTLRSVERVFLILKTFKNYRYDKSKEIAVEDLKKLVSCISWDTVAEFWKENCKYQKILKKRKLKNGQNADVPQEAVVNDDLIRECLLANDPGNSIQFRVSANRIGKSQSITSVDAEQHFGGALQDFTSWKVDLTNYNFEVLVTLGVDFVMINLSLTHESLHRRNIVDFGFTTLKASIAYNMLHMCRISPGDIVIDPMCGTGAIPIESVQEWKNSYHIAGDKSSSALSKCQTNVFSINNLEFKRDIALPSIRAPIDILRWDVKKLPILSNKVDVFVTDVPFGKRSGSKIDNRILYPLMLTEMARVCKRKTGRACILTNDRRAMMNALSSLQEYWKLKRTGAVNVGGLRAAFYLLKRTDQI